MICRSRRLNPPILVLDDATSAVDVQVEQQIHEALVNPPGYTAVRTLLTILEKKGHVRHRSDGTRVGAGAAVRRGSGGRGAGDRGRLNCEVWPETHELAKTM